MLSLALCQHLSALVFQQNPACRDATWKHLPRSDVYCYFTWRRKVFGKKKKKERGRSAGSITKASLFKKSNCLFKYCYGESQRWMAHLFFPFRLSSWIFSGRLHPQQLWWVGGGHGNRKCRRVTQFSEPSTLLHLKPLVVIISINLNFCIHQGGMQGILTSMRNWWRIISYEIRGFKTLELIRLKYKYSIIHRKQVVNLRVLFCD